MRAGRSEAVKTGGRPESQGKMTSKKKIIIAAAAAAAAVAVAVIVTALAVSGVFAGGAKRSASGAASSQQAPSSSTLSAAASGTSGASGASGASGTSSAVVTVSVTVTPGLCVPQIAQKLEDAGVCTKTDFYSAVNSYAFTESCLTQIPYDPAAMCYRLEGYLYPDTYEFYKGMKAQDAVGKMLRNADSYIYGKYDFSTVILASIIEKEAPDAATMSKVSSVFHNRLNNSANYPTLGSAATYNYLMTYLAAVDQSYVDKYKSYYNTVRADRRRGLTSGPICSPGADALRAAKNPESTNYYYFANDKNGKYYFAATAAENDKNLAVISSVNKS
jgi:UPF0755 protein